MASKPKNMLLYPEPPKPHDHSFTDHARLISNLVHLIKALAEQQANWQGDPHQEPLLNIVCRRCPLTVDYCEHCPFEKDNIPAFHDLHGKLSALAIIEPNTNKD